MYIRTLDGSHSLTFRQSKLLSSCSASSLVFEFLNSVPSNCSGIFFPPVSFATYSIIVNLKNSLFRWQSASEKRAICSFSTVNEKLPSFSLTDYVLNFLSVFIM